MRNISLILFIGLCFFSPTAFGSESAWTYGRYSEGHDGKHCLWITWKEELRSLERRQMFDKLGCQSPLKDKDGNKVDRMEILHCLGNQGWELVGFHEAFAYSNSPDGDIIYYFKRQTLPQ